MAGPVVAGGVGAAAKTGVGAAIKAWISKYIKESIIEKIIVGGLGWIGSGLFGGVKFRDRDHYVKLWGGYVGDDGQLYLDKSGLPNSPTLSQLEEFYMMQDEFRKAAEIMFDENGELKGRVLIDDEHNLEYIHSLIDPHLKIQGIDRPTDKQREQFSKDLHRIIRQSTTDSHRAEATGTTVAESSTRDSNDVKHHISERFHPGLFTSRHKLFAKLGIFSYCVFGLLHSFSDCISP